MNLHRPGLPEDLPSPELLWARWGTLAVVTADSGLVGDPDPTGYWLDEEGLHFNDPGSSWWTLLRDGEGRALLFGEDESSAVSWHEPPVDLLAEAPDWLPYERLQFLPEGHELGCVYWYGDGTWGRAPYPEGLRDDGLAAGIGRFTTRDGAAAELEAHLEGEVPLERIVELLAHAEQETLTQGLLETFVAESGWADSDPHAMTEALGHSGLDGRLG